jgi:hypothetical protein
MGTWKWQRPPLPHETQHDDYINNLFHLKLGNEKVPEFGPKFPAVTSTLQRKMNKMYWFLPSIKHLDAEISQSSDGYTFAAVHVRFVVYEVAMALIFLKIILFSI